MIKKGFYAFCTNSHQTPRAANGRGMTAAARSPAFQFYAADFLADENVALMSNQELGSQFRDIMAAAQRGDRGALMKCSWIGGFAAGGDAARRPTVPMDRRKRVMQAGKCAYCSSTHRLELDHIIPWSRGGTHDETNLQCLCKQCNRRKYNRMESEL